VDESIFSVLNKLWGGAAPRPSVGGGINIKYSSHFPALRGSTAEGRGKEEMGKLEDNNGN